MLRLFNTLTREKEDFRPLIPEEVGIYSCGPTVYDYVHIGNLTSFLFADILKRWLIFSGFKVKHVMNLTDVDDKTIRASRKEGISLATFTGRYSDAFFSDLNMLNVMPADVYPKATEHIPEMVVLIKRLLDNGNAYYGKDDSIYFRIKSFPEYGKLAGDRMNRSGESGSNDYSDAKEDSFDFVLWKAYKPEEDGDVFWQTDIGKGRPGWHIECSAMSMKYLGESFDIHTGGVDLIFPHHQNEIAQSEGATGKQFVKIWMHHEFLRLNDGQEKMSKSLGGILKLKDIALTLDDALAFRYLRFATHYRTFLTYSDEVMASAKSSIRRLRRLHKKLSAKASSDVEGKIKSLIIDTKREFIEKMNDDLNTPQALAVLYGFVEQIERMLSSDEIDPGSAFQALSFMDEVDSILGVIRSDTISSKKAQELSNRQKELIQKRESARKEKNWGRADEIRSILLEQGIFLKDLPDGVHWSWL